MDLDTALANGLTIFICLVLALPTLLVAYYTDFKPSNAAKMQLKKSPKVCSKDPSPAHSVLSTRQCSRITSHQRGSKVQYRIRMTTFDNYEFFK